MNTEDPRKKKVGRKQKSMKQTKQSFNIDEVF